MSRSFFEDPTQCSGFSGDGGFRAISDYTVLGIFWRSTVDQARSVWIRDRQLLRRVQRDDLRAFGVGADLFLDACRGEAVARRAVVSTANTIPTFSSIGSR